MSYEGEWNPAVVDGDPTTQCTARNGCRCLLGEGHQRDHRCAHGYWINHPSDDTPKGLPEPNPFLACNYECPECGVHAGHDSDCSWEKP